VGRKLNEVAHETDRERFPQEIPDGSAVSRSFPDFRSCMSYKESAEAISLISLRAGVPHRLL